MGYLTYKLLVGFVIWGSGRKIQLFCKFVRGVFSFTPTPRNVLPHLTYNNIFSLYLNDNQQSLHLKHFINDYIKLF